jgi:hypothetical protein
MSAERAGNEQHISLVEEHSQQDNAPAGEDQAASVTGLETTGETETQFGETRQQIIWTPRFMICFGLVVVLGLSLESILTQGWLNRYYTGQWVFQGHVILDALAWVVLLVVAKGRWTRIGAVFGLLWVFFMTVNILVQVIFPALPLAALSHINVLTCLSLLGCFVCLSIDRFPVRPWDAWVLGLLPALGLALTALLFLTGADHSLSSFEDAIATVTLILSALAWLARPTCWRSAPAPTLLFSFVPLTLLVLNSASAGFNAANFFLTRVVLIPDYNATTTESNFFFSQVVLLCILLGTIRLVKCEVTN